MTLTQTLLSSLTQIATEGSEHGRLPRISLILSPQSILSLQLIGA